MSDRTGVDTDRSADSITVLFVDDDRQWAQLMAEDIEAEADAITVTVAGSATECLETFRDRDDIDCILSDYQMPGTDGLQLLEQVREEHPRLPFLLVTSQGSELVAARATDAGVTDYLIKTVGGEQAQQFVTKIEKAVAHRRLQRAIEESEQRYRTLTEQSRDGVAIVQDGQLRFCNDRLIELTGRRRAALQDGDIVAEVVHQDDRDQVRAVVDSWFEGEDRALLHEARIVRPGRTIRHCEFTGGRIDYGGEAAVLLSIRDVTERNRRERELQWERELSRTMQKALIESRTREALERAVVSQLHRQGYALAWVGERDGEELVPRAVAGDRAYLEAVDRALADGTDGEPAVRAVRTGDPQFLADFDEGSPAAWRETAESCGYAGGAGVPLAYNDVAYGVLAVYHDRPNRFDGSERRLLTELADTVAFAVHSIEMETTLAADRVVDVTVQVADPTYYLVDLARDGGFADREVRVHGTVPHDDALLQYLSVERRDAAEGDTRDSAVATAGDALGAHPDVSDVRLVGEGGSTRLQVTVTGPVPEHLLATRGVVVRETTVTAGAATVSFELPAKSAVRSTVERLESAFDSVSVVSVVDRETHERGRGNELTDKQAAALEAAYHHGYFESPRKSSATDVADALGIAHSTFLQHLRVAQQKVFEARFD